MINKVGRFFLAKGVKFVWLFQLVLLYGYMSGCRVGIFRTVFVYYAFENKRESILCDILHNFVMADWVGRRL